jgi:exosortase A
MMIDGAFIWAIDSSNVMQTPYLQRYTKPLLLLVLFLCFVLAYQGVLIPLTKIWNGDEAAGGNHGWLVFGCSLYLLFLHRETFLTLKARPSVLGLGCVVVLAVLWLLASITQVQAIQLGVLPLLLLAACWALLGFEHFKAALIPVGLLLFALPVWDPLLPLLQKVTTAVTHFNLKLIGRPVRVEGFFIHVSGGSFVIEEACSGLRFLLVSSTLSLMSSSMNLHSWKQGAKLLAIAWGLSCVANWIRVLVVILLGDYTRMQHPWVEDHANFGWVLFLVTVLLPFFWISSREPITAIIKRVPGQPLPRATASYALQAVAILALLMPPLILSTQLNAIQGAQVATALPQQVGSWASQSLSTTTAAEQANDSREWRPAFSGYTRLEKGTYQLNDQLNAKATVTLQVVHYADQQQGVELINVENMMVDDETWVVQRASESSIAVSSGGATQRLNTLVVTDNKTQNLRVWYWYSVGGFTTSSKYLAKLYQVAAFFQGRQDANLVTVSIDCGQDCKAQDPLLESFVNALPTGFPG